MVSSRRQVLSGIAPNQDGYCLDEDPLFLTPRTCNLWQGGRRGEPSEGREQRAQSKGRRGRRSPTPTWRRGVPGAEPPPEEKDPRPVKRDRAAAGLTSIWETARRGADDDGRQAQPQDAAEPQPEGRLRLPELRLARSGRRAQDGRVLRERRQGGRLRRRRSARITPEFFAQHSHRRSAGAERHLATTSRAASRIRWCVARASDHYEPISWDDAFALIAERAQRARLARTRRRSTRRGAPATKRRSSTTSSPASSAPTTCPTARTCATNRAASG